MTPSFCAHNLIRAIHALPQKESMLNLSISLFSLTATPREITEYDHILVKIFNIAIYFSTKSTIIQQFILICFTCRYYEEENY